MHRSPLLGGGALALLLVCGCGREPQAERAHAAPAANPTLPAEGPQAPKPALAVKLDLDEIQQRFASEPKGPPPPLPANSAMIALGRTLYHDRSLSKNGNLACATCHDLGNHGVDGKPTSPGSDGKHGGRNTPTSLNAFRHFAQFWDGRAASVEEQAIGPVLNPIEHGIKDEAELLAKLQAKPELVAAFEPAFPGSGAVSVEHFKTAIGAFERTLVTHSRWDEFLGGKAKALSDVEKLGLQTFLQTGCTECHNTRLLGGDSFQPLGKARSYPVADQGRFEVTKNAADKQVFKVPSLVNVARTAPYFHDGSKPTLEETVKTMADVQLGVKLGDDKVAAVVAFLQATTGEVPAGAVSK